MSSFEFKGKNVEKALKKACDELNLIPDEINYDVISYGSSGIFGLAGVKKAKIRVILPEKSEEPTMEPETPTAEDEISDERIWADAPSVKNDDSDDQQSYTSASNPLVLGREVLQRIVDAITSDAKIATEESPEKIIFNISGGNAGMLIGKKGQTLEAIQSLVEKIVNRHDIKDRVRIQVDVEGYLETRKINLERLAIRLADKSKRIRKPISLGQMNAYDRRIVHMALKDDPEVRTKSRGEGFMRKLVIFPKKNSVPRQHLQ